MRNKLFFLFTHLEFRLGDLLPICLGYKVILLTHARLYTIPLACFSILLRCFLALRSRIAYANALLLAAR